MQKFSTLFYGIGQGLKNIRRNRMFSLASIGTMSACLFLFGIFYFVLANFQYIVKSAETNVGVTVFFDEGISPEQIKELEKEILKRAEVSRILFTSAEEAWEKYSKKTFNEKLMQSFGDDNPLEHSASFMVFLNDVTMQNSLVKYIKELDGVRQVNDIEELAAGLSGFNKAVAYVSGAIIVILLGVATFLISNTVTMGISVRKQEISIMKLIGATDFFIRIPFIVEGILIGLIGAGLPLVILYAMYYKLVEIISEKLESAFLSFGFLNASSIFSVLIPVSLLIGMGIGFIGSYITLRRQLRKIELN